MADYDGTVYDWAKLAGKTAAEVALLSYGQVATAAKVKIAVNGNSPTDFFYDNVRRTVSGRLAQEEEAATLAAFAPTIETEIRKIAGLVGATVEVVGGDFLIRRAK